MPTQFSPKATRNIICTKLDPLVSLARRNLNIARKLPIFYASFTHFMEEKLSFPVFPRIKSTSKFVKCSPRKDSLRYVSVHFTVLWRSCQIFPFNKSFNALLDDYRTGEEPCSQLLRHLCY